MPIVTENYNVGGIAIDVFSLPSNAAASSLPVAILFALHGRGSSKKQLVPLAEATLNYSETQIASGKIPSHELYVIALVILRHLLTS